MAVADVGALLLLAGLFVSAKAKMAQRAARALYILAWNNLEHLDVIVDGGAIPLLTPTRPEGGRSTMPA
jgi:hypothetical protein